MAWLKPKPEMAAANAPFYEGLKQRKFLVPKCQSCGAFNWTPYPACRNCLSTDQKWEQVSGKGELYTFTEIHKGPKVFSENGSYIEAFMELEESPRPILVHGNLVGVPHDRIQLGMKLKIAYFDVPDHDMALFQFEAGDV